jgi:hypothetical protein
MLKCHVLIGLKVADFNHEHLGQLNTYVSWYKRNAMTKGDNPPIGLLLCTRKGPFACRVRARRPAESVVRVEVPARAADSRAAYAVLGSAA